MKTIDNMEFLTIKEFAGFVGINEQMLRHYDNKGIFFPAKHGIEFENKYRYYSPTQITTIKMIRILTKLRVPLDTIKGLAQSRTPEKLLKVLKRYHDLLKNELLLLQDSFSVINTYIELLYEGISATEPDIIVSEIPNRRILLGDINDFSDSTGFMREFTRFCSAPHEPKLNMSYPIGGYWENMETFLNEPSQPTRFFSLDPAGNDMKDAGQFLIGYTRGYYGETNDLPLKMIAYAEKNNLTFIGPVYNIYLYDELSIVDHKQYLLQVSASVKDTRSALSPPVRRRF